MFTGGISFHLQKSTNEGVNNCIEFYTWKLFSIDLVEQVVIKQS